MLRSFIVITIVVAVIAGGLGLWAYAARRTVDPTQLLDRTAFRCYAVSESMRTIGFARHKRKRTQIARIERLLTCDLEKLDEAKLRGELAILRQEAEDARFQRDCAEAWYQESGTRLKDTWETTPDPMDWAPIETSFKETMERVPERLWPHGFDERAALHTAEAALAQSRPQEAITLARAYLEANPKGLYNDSLQLTLADALLQLGDQREALALYEDVGQLRIGQEAQYARYRASIILRSEGQLARADELFEDVVKWARRGGHRPLARLLGGGDGESYE